MSRDRTRRLQGCPVSGLSPSQHLQRPDGTSPSRSAESGSTWSRGAGFAGAATRPCGRHLRRRPRPGGAEHLQRPLKRIQARDQVPELIHRLQNFLGDIESEFDLFLANVLVGMTLDVRCIVPQKS